MSEKASPYADMKILQNQVSTLTAALARAEKDAERYRLLRTLRTSDATWSRNYEALEDRAEAAEARLRARAGHTNPTELEAVRTAWQQLNAENKTLLAENITLRDTQREREGWVSGNYIADKEIEPREVRFANGRVVRVVGEGYLTVEKVDVG